MKTCRHCGRAYMDTDKICTNCGAKLKSKLSTKNAVIICVCAIGFAFIIIFALSQLIPNATSDKDFIDVATSFVTVDYSDYQDKIKKTEGITNMDRVNLWGATGKGEYQTDNNRKYITTLKWTSKDIEYYDVLLEQLKAIYGDDPTEENSSNINKWKIYSSSEYKNLSSVSLSRKNNIMTIVWETANNAYLIDYSINNLDEITLDSKEELDDIQSSYNKLDDNYKEYVEQYDELEKYYDEYYILYVDYFDKTAEECIKSKSADNYDTAAELLEEYKNLDKKYQKAIKKYDVAKKAKSNSKSAKHDEIIEKLNSKCTCLDSYEAYSIKSTIEDNIELLSKKEISSYLAYAVCDDLLLYSETEIKSYLKNPSSYTRYDYGIRTEATNEKDDLYYVSVLIEYGATNSFNAMVKDSKTLYVYYRVNDKGITYEKTEFSEYDKWLMTQ